jgi:hypothetical protein
MDRSSFDVLASPDFRASKLVNRLEFRHHPKKTTDYPVSRIAVSQESKDTEDSTDHSRTQSLLELTVEAAVSHLFQGPSADDFTLRDEANAIVAYAFRNGPIEQLHAGKYSPLLEDKSLSRITDEEVKTLMIHACRRVEELLRLKQSNPTEYEARMRDYHFRYCDQWER